jgi:hypothetical protein
MNEKANNQARGKALAEQVDRANGKLKDKPVNVFVNEMLTMVTGG